MGPRSPKQLTVNAMRHPSKEHRDALPDHVPPICIPETKEEAEEIVQLLDYGTYPSCDESLGLTEQELIIRGA